VHQHRIARAARASLAIVALLAAAAGAADVPGDDPRAPVDTLHGELLSVMKAADELGYQGRFDRLSPVLGDLFDIPFMAEKSVGRYWRKANDAERKQLLDTFGRFTAANYAGRFDGYSGQIFETLGTQSSSHGTVIVQTQLVQTDGDVVELDYRLRKVNGNWKIIDVYLNGTVSELALRRSEYSSLIQREGFGALLAALDEKITTLAAAPADQAL
jgi:phospholipid transport system substrate-binding protein